MRNNVKYPRADETFGGWFGSYVIGKAMRHALKATKWHIMKVPTGPVMHPSCETASKIYTILSKGLLSVKFSV